MDYSSVLAYKTLFLANRAKGTKEQLDDGKKCTALANGVRCAITTTQGIVPLFAVSNCLAQTAQNPTVANAAKSLAESNLKNIALAINSGKTAEALKGVSSTVGFLSKLGLAGNIAYAAAKCIDADEEDKTRTFMKATGNCAGMYLFENIYSHVVDKINPADINNATASLNELIQKIPALKSVKVSSIIFGIGFVVASLFGCKMGELFGESLVKEQNVA